MMNFNARVESDFQKYQDLGICVYAVNFDGVMIFMNDMASSFFNRPIGFNVEDVYSDFEHRKPILEMFKAVDNESWICDKNIHYAIDGKSKIQKYSAKIYKDNVGELLGSLCIGVKVNHFEVFEKFEPNLPVGFFEINSKEEFAYINDEFKKIVGIPAPSLEEIISEGDLIKMRTRFFKNKKRVFSPIRIISRNAEVKLVQIVLDPIFKNQKSDSKIIGARGVIRDITRDLIYEKVPIGLYMLDTSEDQKKIVWHNSYFQEIHNKALNNNEGSLYGRDITDFYKDPSEHKFLEKKISNDGGEIADYKVDLKNNIRVLINANDLLNHKLRVGTTTDITNSVDNWIKETREDFRNFLHTFSSYLGMFSDNMLDVAKTLDDDKILTISSKDSGVSFDLEHAEKKLDQNIKALRSYLKNLFVKYPSDSYKNRVNKELDKIGGHDEYLPMSIAIWVRDRTMGIHKIINEMFKLPMQKVNRSTQKEVIRSIKEVLNSTNIISIQNYYAELDALWEELNLLKEYLITGNFKTGNKTEVNLKLVLTEAISSLAEFSKTERTEINLEVNYNCYSLSIMFRKHHLKMAFFNVIHNAIKYSYSKASNPKLPYVDISMKLNSKNDKIVAIRVENRGVQIYEDEIPRIQQWATRGEKSSDRGRPGTGIGLFHTVSVLNDLGGTLDIESKPVGGKESYDGPYKNAVTLNIPI